MWINNTRFSKLHSFGCSAARINPIQSFQIRFVKQTRLEAIQCHLIPVTCFCQQKQWHSCMQLSQLRDENLCSADLTGLKLVNTEGSLALKPWSQAVPAHWGFLSQSWVQMPDKQRTQSLHSFLPFRWRCSSSHRAPEECSQGCCRHLATQTDIIQEGKLFQCMLFRLTAYSEHINNSHSTQTGTKAWPHSENSETGTLWLYYYYFEWNYDHKH